MVGPPPIPPAPAGLIAEKIWVAIHLTKYLTIALEVRELCVDDLGYSSDCAIAVARAWWYVGVFGGFPMVGEQGILASLLLWVSRF